MALLQPMGASAAKQVTLAWQPSPDTNVVGYVIYYGLESGGYASMISVTNITRATITDLGEGLKYYFAVTAFTEHGLESVPSNEVSYFVPGVRLTIKKLSVSGFQNSVLIGSTSVISLPWALEATHDLQTWRTLARGTNSVVNVAVVSQNTPWMLLRLRSP